MIVAVLLDSGSSPIASVAPVAQGLSQDEIAADMEFCQMLASLKYLRANYTPYAAHDALYETLSLWLSNCKC